MSQRTYYCFCEANCKFETMTKEQILAAIAQAAAGGLVFDTEAAFITKVQETNAGAYLTFWVGTQAQYNALEETDPNCYYIITDSDKDQQIAYALAAAAAAETAAAQAKQFTMAAASTNGTIEDILDIDSANPFAEKNKPMICNSTALNAPENFGNGVREVFFYGQSWAYVRLTGAATDGTLCIWLNRCILGSWTGWNCLGGDAAPTPTPEPGELITAALSDPVYYIGSEIAGSGTKVGRDGSGNAAMVRYTLATSEGAAAGKIKVKIDSGNYTSWRDYSSDLYNDILDESVWLNFYIGAKTEEFRNDGSQVTGRVFFRLRSGVLVEESYKFDMVLSSSDAGIDPDSYSSLSACFEAAPLADATLAPNTEYYLWIFPAFTSYGIFNWNGSHHTNTIELSAAE